MELAIKPYNKSSVWIKLTLILSMVCPILVYAIKPNIKIIYTDLVYAHTIAFIIAMIRYLRKKHGKQLDFEIAIGLTAVDLVTRHFLPIAVHYINSLIAFLLLIVFLRRQILLSFKENIIFLTCYGGFYFILNLKYLEFDIKGAVGLIYSVVLSVLFAYSLLATSREKNFYRCTFCGGIALLCLIVLGKRAIGNFDNGFVIAQASVSVLNAFTFIYWYEGREYYAALKRVRKPIFNVQFLTIHDDLNNCA
jgi:hypothetical protein